MPSSRNRATRLWFVPRAVSTRERGVGMKLLHRTKSAPTRPMSRSDRTVSRLMGVGVLTLALGIPSFGFIYYRDQHVDAGPSLIDRQTQSAEQAVRKEPNNVGARLALAASYQSEKKTDAALKQYDEILKADGASRPALMGRGGALLAKGDLNAAAASYRKITGKAVKGEFAGADPQLQEAYYYLGSIALKQGKTAAAVTELEHALKITRSDSDALYLIGVARLKQNKPKLAVDALKQALLFVPTGWCEPYSQLAKAHRQLGNAPQATYASAMVDFCLKKPTDAKRKLKTLVSGPVAVDAMLGLGLIAETASSNAEAIGWYQKVVAVDAKNVGAQSALSRLGAKPSAPSASPSLGAK